MRGALRVAAVAVVCVMATACTSDVEVPRGMGDSVVVTDAEGVCGLLAIEEVEVAVNRPLSGTRTGGGPAGEDASDGAEADSREAEAGAPAGEGEVPGEDAQPPGDPAGGDPVPRREPTAEGVDPRTEGSGTLQPILPGMEMCALGSARAGAAWGVLTEDGAGWYGRYAQWHGSYLEEVRVDGHEAVWDPALRTLLVRTGDDVFGLTLTADDPPLADDEGAYLEEWARELASRALRRG